MEYSTVPGVMVFGEIEIQQTLMMIYSKVHKLRYLGVYDTYCVHTCTTNINTEVKSIPTVVGVRYFNLIPVLIPFIHVSTPN